MSGKNIWDYIRDSMDNGEEDLSSLIKSYIPTPEKILLPKTKFDNIQGLFIQQVFFGNRLNNTLGKNLTTIMDWEEILRYSPILGPQMRKFEKAHRIAAGLFDLVAPALGGSNSLIAGKDVRLHYFGPYVGIHRCKKTLNITNDPEKTESKLIFALIFVVLVSMVAVTKTASLCYKSMESGTLGQQGLDGSRDNSLPDSALEFARIAIQKVFPLVEGTCVNKLTATEQKVAGIREVTGLLGATKEGLVNQKEWVKKQAKATKKAIRFRSSAKESVLKKQKASRKLLQVLQGDADPSTRARAGALIS